MDINCGYGGTADTAGSKLVAARRESSNLSARTINFILKLEGVYDLLMYWIGAAEAQLSYKQWVTGSNPVSSTLINVLSTKRENAKTADATLAKFIEYSGYSAISFI